MDFWRVPSDAAMTDPAAATVAFRIRTPAIGVALRTPWRIPMSDTEYAREAPIASISPRPVCANKPDIDNPSLRQGGLRLSSPGRGMIPAEWTGVADAGEQKLSGVARASLHRTIHRESLRGEEADVSRLGAPSSQG